MREMAHGYLVQKWFDGKAGTWQRISANSKLDAAERVTGIKLRTVGKLGDLRARVRVVGDLSDEMAFYASPQKEGGQGLPD
jgi:hypothetical protein